MEIKRGDIVEVNLEPVKGSEQGRTRPAVVIQNDIANKFSPTTIIAPITSKLLDKEYPTDVVVRATNSPLKEDSTVLLNQIRTISIKERIVKRIGKLNKEYMEKIDRAINVSLGLKI